MSTIGRGFIAVVPPEPVLDAIEARVAAVRAAHDGLRWSRRTQWHLTLRFLGRVPDVDRVVDALHHALPSVARIDALQLRGAGAFPTTARASVVWLGVRNGADALMHVAQAVERASVAVGFAPDTRGFSAHLTVARTAPPRDVRAVVDALGDDPVGRSWPVDHVAVISSETCPSGAVYSEVARVPLATGIDR